MAIDVDTNPALDAAELRELVPAALILESLAVRRSPSFDAAAIEDLRRASEQLRDAVGDPAAAARAEHEFERVLVERSGDVRVRRAAMEVLQALRPYRRAAPVGPMHHGEIVDALERGDHDAAAARIRATFTATLARLLAGVDRRRRSVSAGS